MLSLSRVQDWTKGRFVMNSGFYAGRGPTQSDLNFDLLEMLYTGIKKDVGVDVAKNFVRFVNQLNDLSASAFVVAFERFAASDGKAVDVAQDKSDSIRLTGYGEARDAQAFAVIANTLGGKKRSEAELRQAHDSIKSKFIRAHEKEIPTKERREIRVSTYSL